MVHKSFAIWIWKDPTSHHLSKLELPLNQLLCQHSKESLVHTIKLCITNNTKDSRLFTKETILVYISPFSIFNTWPLHWQVLGFSGNPGTCLFSAQSAIHRQCSLIVHAVQTNPLTHPQLCLDSSVSLSLSLSQGLLLQGRTKIRVPALPQLLFCCLAFYSPTTFHSLSNIIWKCFVMTVF